MNRKICFYADIKTIKLGVSEGVGVLLENKCISRWCNGSRQRNYNINPLRAVSRVVSFTL